MAAAEGVSTGVPLHSFNLVNSERSPSWNIFRTDLTAFAKNGLLTSVGDSKTSSVVPREHTGTCEKWCDLANVAKIVAASPDGSKMVSLEMRFVVMASAVNL